MYILGLKTLIISSRNAVNDQWKKELQNLYPNLNIGISYNDIGYYVGTGGTSESTYIGGLNTNDELYVITDTSKANSMWLAAPSGYGKDILLLILYNGYLSRKFR